MHSISFSASVSDYFIASSGAHFRSQSGWTVSPTSASIIPAVQPLNNKSFQSIPRLATGVHRSERNREGLSV